MDDSLERARAAASGSDSGASPAVQRAGRWFGAALFVALLVAPLGGLDAPQRRAAAVTALVATLWLTQGVPLAAASLLPAALFPLLGVLSAREASVAYMDDLVLLFLGAFMVASGLERWGVHRRMALALVAAFGVEPRRLVLGFIVATGFVSLWINNTAATLMMYPIGLAVISTVGGRRSSPFAHAMLLGIGYAASIGGVATPVGTAPNQLLLGALRNTFPGAPPISFATWTTAWLPFAALYLVVLWLLLTRVALRVGAGAPLSRDVIAAERATLGRMSSGERRMAAVFTATAVLWVTRGGLDFGAVSIPGWGAALAQWQVRTLGGVDPEFFARHVTDATVAIAMSLVCFFLPADRSRKVRLLDWESAGKLPWDVLLLFGGGFCIGKAFAASGLDRALGQALAPAIQGQPAWLVIAIVAAFMTFLSEIASNTALTVIALPVLASAAVQGGYDPRLVMIPATIAASCGFMLPVGTPPNAVVFSSGLVPIGTMARVGLLVDVVGVVLITLVFYFWGRTVLGIESGLPTWAVP
jgi:sodium-dependent dicarboxylate transporter 2/3/5